MKREKKVWAITLIVLWWLTSSKINAQQNQDSVRMLKEVVVTGTKFELPVEKSGKTIYRFNEQSLRSQSGRSISEILNDVPAIQIDGNFGTPSSNLNYYVRGSRNNQTLIQIDGVPMNDPSGINAFYDVRYLSVDQLKSVEILQGGLSTLYGSSASASVINIQTKTAEVNGVHGGVDLNAGSWNTFGQNINLSGKQDEFSFQLLGNNYSSQGFSAALDKSNTATFDKDGIEKRNGFIKVGYQFNDKFKIDVFAGSDWFDAKFDAGPFQDSNDSQVQSQTRLGLKANYNYRLGNFQWVTQQLSNSREFKSKYPAVFDGDNIFSEIIHTHKITSFAKLLSGVSYQELKYGQKDGNRKDTTKFTIIDPYTSLFLDFNFGLQLHVGARLNTHSVYDNKVLYNVNPSWNIQLNNDLRLKILGSISTSYITPSLYQLYAAYYGNKELKPEEDLNYEYGVSLTSMGKFTLNAVNFFREEKNTIGFTNRYANLTSQRKVNGVTLDGSFTVNDQLNLKADFTYQTTDNEKSFYRIPKQKFGFGISLKPLPSTLITANYHHTGKRTDLYYDENFSANEVNLASYDLIDISAMHEFNKMFMVYGNVNNLFNEDFIGVYGYTTRGRNFTIGVKYSF